MEKEYSMLPLGTVVLLKNEITMYMIVTQSNKNGDGRLPDYISVPFPYGLIGSRCIKFFDNTDIDTIIHLGYENNNKNIDEKE